MCTPILVALGVRSEKDIEIEMVTEQLLSVCNGIDILKNPGQKHIEDNLLDRIYQYLDDKASREPEHLQNVVPLLEGKPIISLGTELLPVSKVAFTVAFRCEPELYEIGKNKIKRYRRFLEAIGVKERFDIGQIIDIFKKKNELFYDLELPPDEFRLMRNLLELLTELMLDSQLTYEDDLSSFGVESIVAPDAERVLRPTYTLCLDDPEFDETSSSMLFVHSDVSRTVAQKLGVFTKRSKFVQECSIGMPFEQKEELVTRLRGLLDGYPCDIGIMKELIQNADDANATEVHFVKDFRTHSYTKIFDESFEEFQGPALIVFNDSPFTEEDLYGIRKLGIGSKHTDPAKTGQYGVGFNAVYNLTDLPSFLTKGPEIGETLCLFDPLQKHCKRDVGRRYDTNRVKQIFPDVLSGFSEDSLFCEKDTGSIFRFPLRQSESRISRNVITTDKLNSMLTLFKAEMLDMLLFARSVSKITISDISSGTLKKEASVSVDLNEKDLEQRRHLAMCCKERAQALKQSTSSMFTSQPIQISYELHSIDRYEQQQTWFVVQRIGVSENSIADSVKQAVDERRLGMLPIGGVAARVPRKEKDMSSPSPFLKYNWAIRSSSNQHDSGRMYCFLPLPDKTGLPMHINGHFALDHEARRSLWKEEEGYKSSWNFLLLSDVVSRAYIEALKYMKSKVFEEDTHALYDKSSVIEKIEILSSFFPIFKKAKDSYVKHLVKRIFENMLTDEEELFPTPLYVENDAELHTQATKYGIKWSAFHPTDHKFPVYFVQTNALIDPIIRLLSKTGLKVAICTSEMLQSMNDAACRCIEVNPDDAVAFLRTCNSSYVDKAIIGQLPAPIQKTIFQNISNIDHLLKYCSQAKGFIEGIMGLPLLVTNDCSLRCFDVMPTLYCTEYCSLFGKSADRFVHVDLVHTMVNTEIAGTSEVIQNITLPDLVELLRIELDHIQYTIHDLVKFVPSTGNPNMQWIHIFWEFVAKEFIVAIESDSELKFENYLQPLADWCLIPAVKEKKDNFLIKIKQAGNILAMETFECIPPLCTALKKLELPVVNKNGVPVEALEPLYTCLATANNPVLLLSCLSYYRESVSRDTLNKNDSCEILSYFSNHLAAMQADSKVELQWIVNSLKSLPIFFSLDKKHVSLEDERLEVLVLPSIIPVDGIEIWASETNKTLLLENYSLENIYDFLGLSCTEDIDVYLNHVLKTWHSLPVRSTLKHLEFMKDHLLAKSPGKEFSVKQWTLIETLKTLEVIPYQHCRKKASDFFSSSNVVFKTMCSSESFPPGNFADEEWNYFLELIGLKSEVTAELFIQFANEVALEGRHGISQDIKSKSRVLVKHLLSSPHPWTADVFPEVSEIKFVAPCVAQKKFTDVFRQCIDTKCLMQFSGSVSCRYEELSWTSLPLLPSEADPQSYHFGMKQAARNRNEYLLGIHSTPRLEDVILHSQNLCDSLKDMLRDTERKAEISQWLPSFMRNLYRFLLTNGISTDIARTRLYHTPIIFIPDQMIIVPAHRTVMTILPEQEIIPYLVKAPPKYGEFSDLFTYLGAAERPSYLLYVKVLKEIKDRIGESILDDEYMSEWLTITAAIDNIFKSLKADSRVQVSQDDTSLYLPSRDRKLLISSHIVISNHPCRERRLKNVDSIQYFLGFRELQLEHTTYDIDMVPVPHRPKYLTDITTEEVDTTSMSEKEDSEAASKLENFLQSSDFIQAVIRMMKHVNRRRSKTTETVNEEAVAFELQNVHVREVVGLQTYLRLNGVRQDTSVLSKLCHKQRRSGVWWIFFQKATNKEQRLLQSIHRLLVEFVEYVSGNTLSEVNFLVYQVIHMMNNPKEIGTFLDESDIDVYDLPSRIFQGIFPAPGTYVPVYLHHLLDCDISDIAEHEFRCVALELEDEAMFDTTDIPESYDPVYIYVQIFEKVPVSRDDSQLLVKYKVYTGEEYITVPCFKIYKFIQRSRDSENRDLVSTDFVQQPLSDENLRKEFYSVEFTLREAWKLTEEDRRQVIKRLYLRWHPDRNKGKEELSSKVFCYLKEIMLKLEKENSLDDDTDGHSQQERSYPDFASSSFFRFCQRMDSRSHSHSAHAQSFYSDDGSYHSDSSQVPVSDMGEAKRWQSQAKRDFRSAIKSMSSDGDVAFNWICYMSHQASEKSLKAAWFARNANGFDRKSHDLRCLARGLTPELHECAQEVSTLLGEHTKMRYPDMIDRRHIPSTVYSEAQARNACEIARKILSSVDENYLA